MRNIDWIVIPPGAPSCYSCGRGKIVARQTTYWEIRTSKNRPVRLHFRRKREARFDRPYFSDVTVSRDHPVLIHYQVPWVEVSFKGAVGHPSAVVERLFAAVDELSVGWRSAAEYLNGLMPTADLLSSNGGVLWVGPASYAGVISEILSSNGSTIQARPYPTPGGDVCAAVMDRSFVVAERFGIEHRIHLVSDV
jgi:hypothetical protein